MASPSAQPLLDRLEDGTHDTDDSEVSLDSGTYSEKLRIGRPDISKRRYIIITAILLFLFVFGIFSFAFVSNSEVKRVEMVPEDGVSTKDTAPDKLSFPPQLLGAPTESLWDNLRNDTQYITGWIDAGWTNDFMTIINLLYVAFLANRTAILPPFKPAHVSSSAGYPAFSEIFDAPRMSALVPGGLPILDWYELKDRTSNHSDELGCWSAWATPRPESGPRGGPLPRFLHVDASYTPVPKDAKLIASIPGEIHIRHTALSALTFPDGRKQARLPAQAPFPGKSGHTTLPDEHLACFDFLYYGSGVYTYEMTYDFSPAWRFVGTHAHWTSQLTELTEQFIASAFGLPKGEPLPLFISMHIRHGDFTTWCDGKNSTAANAEDPGPHSACYAPLSAYAESVKEVRAELLEKQGIDVQRVLITSDEQSSEWWAAIHELGWSWIDHKGMQTVEKYGEWYPVFVDAAAQSMGAGFVGTYKSTMSLMAARRVIDWHGGVWREVNWNDYKHDRSVKFVRSSAPRSLSEFVV